MAKTKSNATKVSITKHEKDSKRYFRYSVGEQGDEIVGSIYISKEMKKLPKRIILDLDADE